MRVATILLAVLASACTVSPYRVSAPLEQTYWRLVALDGKPVSGSSAHLVFETNEQRVRGSTGCNRLAGTWRREGDDLTLGPLAVTKMACRDVAGESAFLAAIERVRHASVTGRNLTLSDSAGAPLAQFQESSPPK